MALDFNKKTGDSFSAAEFNAMVAEINKKIDTAPGKVLSDNNYSDQDRADLLAVKTGLKQAETTIADLVANPASASVVVSGEEQKIGTYRIDGSRDLFERSFELSGLPAAGASKDFTLCDEPLGNNIYLSVSAYAISGEDGYYVNNYSIEKIFVDSELYTKVTVKCNEVVTGAKLVLTLRYIKFDFEKAEFLLTGAGANADAISLGFPVIKHDKRFAYSLIVDDDKVDANKLFFTINKKWVDAEKNQHFGQLPTTGYVPSKFLEYTDGAGVRKRFTYGVAIFPAMGNQYIDNYMDPAGKEIGKNYPYLVWPEINITMDFGNEIHFHNVPATDEKDIASLRQGFLKAQNETLNQAGDGMKVLVRPDGNDTYIDLGQVLADIVFMTTEGGNSTINSITENVNLQKGIIFRRNCDYIEKDAYLSRFTNVAAGSWLCDFTHAPSAGMLEGIVQINDMYGADGDDSILFATIDEIFEYWFIRKYTRIRRSVSGNDIKYTLFIPRLKYGRHTDFSLKFAGLPAGSGIEAATENIVGLSHVLSGSTMLLNLNLNTRLLDLAEKYTAKFEASEDSGDEADARYFVSQLRADLQDPFLARLNAGNVPPVLTSVQINSGAAITFDAIVSISISKTGAVTHFRVGEISDLSQATWQTYTGTISYTLSSSYGDKTVYVQVKNDNGESAIKSAAISYQEQPAVTYTITARPNNSAYGTVTPASQTVGSGGSASVTASAVDGYVIESWTGADASTGVGTASGTASVSNVQADRTIVCNFKSNSTPPPGDTNKWILSVNWSWDQIGFDSATGIDKQMFTSAVKPMHTTTGKELGTITCVGNGTVATASGTQNAGKKGAVTGNDSGVYPDIYLERVVSPFSSNNADELPTLTITLSKIPAGTYIVKLLSNTIDAVFVQSANVLTYSVNGAIIEKESSFPVNNTSNLIEFNNVQVTSDGTIVVKIISPENQKGNPLNLIEIEEI